MLIMTSLFNSWKLLSWERSRTNVSRLQRRIFKAVIVGDLKNCLKFQKLLLSSNSGRFVSIKYINNNVVNTNFMSSVSLTFMEKYKINHYLSENIFSWKPLKAKINFFSSKEGISNKEFSISVLDLTWQILITFVLEPAHEATFHSRNFGLKGNRSLFDAQRILFLNLGMRSFGYQKRIITFSLKGPFKVFNVDLLMSKLILSRSLKIGIFRFLKLGLFLDFTCNNFSSNRLSSLLTNVLLNGIDFIFDGIRFNSEFLIFIKPNDNISILYNDLLRFLDHIGIIGALKDFSIFSSFEGFNFLGWHLKYFSEVGLICTPSFISYKHFLKRVKNIINNSNYGAVIY